MLMATRKRGAGPATSKTTPRESETRSWPLNRTAPSLTAARWSSELAAALVRLSFTPQINKNASFFLSCSLQSGFRSGLCKLLDS